MQPDPLDQAFALFHAGRLRDAEDICQRVLAHEPSRAEALHLVGVIRYQQGYTEAAREFFQLASNATDATAEMHNNLGAVFTKLGRNKEAITAYQRSLALNPNYADALNNIGVAYRDERMMEQAIDAFRRAIALDPELLQAKSNLRAAYRDVVPAWHFAMLDDGARNRAYEAAIRRAVTGKRVLDIGTGAGLLAMMAARAGAASVTTCEAVPLIADRAREIVAQNGFADRVAVIGKPSSELNIGRDMTARAEVLVTETFASGLLSEGILPTVEHAHAQLLTHDATIIPAAASIMGYLAGGLTLQGMLFADRIAGFDLSSFNDFAPPVLVANLNGLPHQSLSADAELIRFNFREKSFPMNATRIALTATEAGACVGISQWIRLNLDAETVYENRPSPHAAYNGHWTHVLHRFPRLVQVAPGDVVNVVLRHDRSQVNIDLAE